MKPLTKAQRDALMWLAEHYGEGGFDDNGMLLAGGELAPHTRSTWNELERRGLVQFWVPAGRRERCRLTDAGFKASGF